MRHVRTVSVVVGMLLASIAPQAIAQAGLDRAVAVPGLAARVVATPIVTGDLSVTAVRPADEPFSAWRIDWSDGRSGSFVAAFRAIDGPAIGPDAPLSSVPATPVRAGPFRVVRAGR